MYKVCVVEPSPKPVQWDYPIGYFPRKVYYLRDAKLVANEAIRRGASLVRIEYPNGAELDMKPPVK